MKAVKVKEKEKKFYENEYHRQLDVGRYVNIHQSVGISSGKWEKAQVSWSAIGSVDPEKAVEFAECVFEAAKIAESWTSERV